LGILSVQAHYRNLSVGLKNDKEQIRVLEPWFDWALSTDCYAYDTCDVSTYNFTCGCCSLW